MSSTLRQTIRSLRAEVLSPRHAPLFEAARERNDAFEPHHTIASVLGTLADERREAYPHREALTRALIAEQQSAPSSFWAATLLLAYYPMLSRLRHRIYGDTLPDPDLDQIVITTFLTVVAEFPLDEKRDRTAMRLKQRTQRGVFRILREDQRHQELVRFTDLERIEVADELGWPGVRDKPRSGPRNPKDAADAVSLLLEHAGDMLDGECFDLVTATLICGRRIPGYVSRLAPRLNGDERRRLYQRIKRRHSRALARLRPALEHLRCPHPDRDGLCQCEDASSPEESAER